MAATASDLLFLLCCLRSNPCLEDAGSSDTEKGVDSQVRNHDPRAAYLKANDLLTRLDLKKGSRTHFIVSILSCFANVFKMAHFSIIAVITMVSGVSLLMVLYQIGSTFAISFSDFARYVHIQQKDGEVPFDPTHKWDTRAAGQQYLLGVGKADITGFVLVQFYLLLS